jgi:hypothetical protein
MFSEIIPIVNFTLRYLLPLEFSMYGSPHKQTDLNKEILCPVLVWLIASNVSGDKVWTTRKVPVMSRAEWFGPASKNGQTWRQAVTMFVISEFLRTTPSEYPMNGCFTKQVIHTVVPQYLQPSSQHIFAEFLRKFATKHLTADFLQRTNFGTSE